MLKDGGKKKTCEASELLDNAKCIHTLCVYDLNQDKHLFQIKKKKSRLEVAERRLTVKEQKSMNKQPSIGSNGQSEDHSSAAHTVKAAAHNKRECTKEHLLLMERENLSSRLPMLKKLLEFSPQK